MMTRRCDRARVDSISSAERRSEQWRYWHAVALLRAGEKSAANVEFMELAQPVIATQLGPTSTPYMP